MIGDKYAFKLPLKSVGALIQQDLPASIRRTVPYDTGIGPVGFHPHLRITEIKTAAALWYIPLIQHRILFIFLIVNPVAHSHALCLHFPVDIAFLMLL